MKNNIIIYKEHAAIKIQKWIKNIFYERRRTEWYEMKQEEKTEREFGREYFRNEPWLWCESCILGICEEH
jgi:hypothetical protein